MDLEYLLEPFFCELSDEAASQIADFLMQLALLFENTHLSQIQRYHQAMRPLQIQRYHQAMRPLPAYDPNQLELFDSFPF